MDLCSLVSSWAERSEVEPRRGVRSTGSTRDSKIFLIDPASRPPYGRVRLRKRHTVTFSPLRMTHRGIVFALGFDFTKNLFIIYSSVTAKAVPPSLTREGKITFYLQQLIDKKYHLLLCKILLSEDVYLQAFSCGRRCRMKWGGWGVGCKASVI